MIFFLCVCVYIRMYIYIFFKKGFFILNLLIGVCLIISSQSAGEWTIYPWVHSNCNSLSDSDQLRPVLIPDIHPARYPYSLFTFFHVCVFLSKFLRLVMLSYFVWTSSWFPPQYNLFRRWTCSNRSELPISVLCFNLIPLDISL